VRIFCDMDGVLVRQTGRRGFDLMPWKDDGRVLWDGIQHLYPTLLSKRPDDLLAEGYREKRLWVSRELGINVPLIVVPDSLGKGPYCLSGDVLIDDGESNRQPWLQRGGVFIHHRSAAESLRQLKAML
jgi:hypothetical protein